jgi:hypothetical protein
VLAMLRDNPGTRYAIEVADLDADPVVVTVAIREIASFVMEIPRHSYDAFTLLELIEKHTLRETSQ